MQGKNIVEYTSRQLKTSERNYPTHDLDLRLFLFQMWRSVSRDVEKMISLRSPSLGTTTISSKNTVPSLCTEKQPYLGTEDLIFSVLQPNHTEHHIDIGMGQYNQGSGNQKSRNQDIRG